MRSLMALSTAMLAGLCVMPSMAGAHSLVRPAGAVVSYLSADATSLNTLDARVSGNRIEFRDETVDGGMDTGNCTPGDLDRNGYIIQAFCPLDPVRRVRIDLGEREDVARVALPVAATVLAGPGADRVSGGPSGEEISGGEGNDVLDGAGGDDVLSGDQGADLIRSGPGSDRIAARDGETDEVVCDAGIDAVEADTLDRVAADCESISRAATAAPAGAAEDDGRPPQVQTGALTVQRVGRSRVVRVFATSSKRGTLSASGSLRVRGLTLPIKTVARKRVRVGGGGAVLAYRLRGRHWREVRKALDSGRRVTVRLSVVGTDTAGRSRRSDAPPVRLMSGGRPAGASVASLRSAYARHPEPGDVDGDEVRDEVDNCPNARNGSQLDTDGDGLGDACDDDDDNDGVTDGSDNCRLDVNPGQENADGDAYGDACPPVDSDGDGLIDDDDNCDANVNPDQSDLDGDDRGDVCDRDDDGDDFDDQYDNCPTVYNIEPTDTNGDGLVNDQPDRDGDGVGTACDPDEQTVAGPAPGTQAGRPDRARPRMTVGVDHRQRLAAVRGGLIVKLRCSEACAATVELEVARPLARRLGLRSTRVLASGSARLQGAGTTYAFVRFDGRARRALFRQRALRTRLTAVAVDRSGNRASSARRVALVR